LLTSRRWKAPFLYLLSSGYAFLASTLRTEYQFTRGTSSTLLLLLSLLLLLLLLPASHLCSGICRLFAHDLPEILPPSSRDARVYPISPSIKKRECFSSISPRSSINYYQVEVFEIAPTCRVIDIDHCGIFKVSSMVLFHTLRLIRHYKIFSHVEIFMKILSRKYSFLLDDRSKSRHPIYSTGRLFTATEFLSRPRTGTSDVIQNIFVYVYMRGPR